MRLATLALLGLTVSLPATAAAQASTCRCCDQPPHHDRAMSHAPSATAASPAYEFQYEGLIGGVIYSVRRQAGLDVQLTIGGGEKSFDVIVAPLNWLDAQHVVFRTGERIEILGTRADRGSSDTIVAREIHTADQTIVLRDGQGRPVYK
jgi:hypothetical protein